LSRWSKSNGNKYLVTQIEIYNGATGTFVAFGFLKIVPEEHVPAVDNFHSKRQRNYNCACQNG
jgi:hypothetical protein